MRKDEPPVVVEQTYDASIETTWRALTELEQMRQWFFDNIPDFRPEAGFETQFDVNSGDRIFRHMWRIAEVVPLQKIKYHWKYPDYPGDSNVVFELVEQDNGTKLRLTCEILEDFPDDIPEFRRESAVAGWTFFLNERLAAFLAGKQ